MLKAWQAVHCSGDPWGFALQLCVFLPLLLRDILVFPFTFFRRASRLGSRIWDRVERFSRV